MVVEPGFNLRPLGLGRPTQNTTFASQSQLLPPREWYNWGGEGNLRKRNYYNGYIRNN